MKYNQLNTKQFIEKARAIHGDKYDYSKVNYINNRTKITIICPDHGEFNQLPSGHMSGLECKKCGLIKQSLTRCYTKEEFVNKAKEVHGDKYDYSKSNYANTLNKIIINCKKHGDFIQRPREHLNGCGCFLCGKERIIVSNSITKEEFVNKARAIHGDKYDYSKVNYINNRTKITIICPDHGEFSQIPNSHLQQKAGCFKCGYERTAQFQTFTREEFIIKAKKIHNNRYDYSEFIYTNSNTKGYVICLTKDHGKYLVTPNNHLHKKSGCPLCNLSKGELFIKDVLDKYNIIYEQEYRIPEIVNKFYYDFYLPHYNALIEFHGIQHYKYISFFHRNGEDDFLAQKNRDNVIRYNAKHYKYRYLEFNYKQLNNNKEQFEQLIINSIKKI